MESGQTVKELSVERDVNGKRIRLQKGDLTMLATDAVVFYAREDLQLGSGFGTAIASRGGAAISKELQTLGRLNMGEAVLTGAGNLKPRHLIHACGPKFHEPQTEEKLRRCMTSVLAAAEKAGLKTIAFPPMGVGFYGVPLELSATVMLETIRQFLQQSISLAEVIICVLDDREFRAFQPRVEAV